MSAITLINRVLLLYFSFLEILFVSISKTFFVAFYNFLFPEDIFKCIYFPKEIKIVNDQVFLLIQPKISVCFTLFYPNSPHDAFL